MSMIIVRSGAVTSCFVKHVNERNLLCKILRNPNIPDIPRARVVDAKQTRPSPVLERVWLRETNFRACIIIFRHCVQLIYCPPSFLR